MANVYTQSTLNAFKAQFHSKNLDLIARISNTAWKLEVLQKKSSTILPETEAASFKAALQPMIKSLGDVKSALLAADGKADAIVIIQREEAPHE